MQTLRTKRITHTEFIEWSDAAREKCDLCFVGKLVLPELEIWLNRDMKRGKG